ncbi:hypothetical protein [Jeotgalibacillus proteolyticus]|uniref:Uncharacterized protein n=1 Tax=Jeotgalibacillus proteolyticus TaxID=2082395 RepID=A0A2S5GHP1_9BACL|nr:hypothetical protein [Jeotgalibacillus proteolyticus]PPA72383.1 hypothetical protein C4B60_03125 [Jeotgalibacillus proteolyticus]
MNNYELNGTFLAAMEWGFVAAVAVVIIFTLLSIKHAPKLKSGFIWLAVHLLFMIGAHLLFWMGLGNQSDSLTPIDNAVDQIHFLMGVAGLMWMMGMLCLVLSIQVIKDTVSKTAKKSEAG